MGEEAGQPSGALPGTPLLLELRRRQVAGRRVDAFEVVGRFVWHEPAIVFSRNVSGPAGVLAYRS